MRLLSEIWSILTPRQRRYALLGQILSILMALCTVAGIAAIAPFFSVLGNPDLIERNAALHWLFEQAHFSSQRSFMVALGLGFMALVFISNLINLLGGHALSRLALWIGADLQSTLLWEYLRRPYSFYAGRHSTLLAHNVIHETTRSTNEVLQNVFALNGSLVTGSLIIVSVVLLNPWVAASLIVLLAGGYLAIYLGIRRRLHTAGEAQSQEFAAQAKLVDEVFGALKEILLLQVQGFYQAAFERHSRQLARSGARIELIVKSPRHIMECVAVFGLVLAALFAAGPEAGAGAWLGKLTFLGFAAYRLLPTLQQSFASLVKIRSGRPSFDAILPDLKTARARPTQRTATSYGEWSTRPLRDIVLDQVSFSYDPARGAALCRVSMCIASNTAIGIVGANGSGKTTVADVIAGLLVPASGQLKVDGHCIDDSNRERWQRRIAYVPQHVYLMDGTIEHNIALGRARADIDFARLYEAARLAQLEVIIDALPDGYQQIVGEHGMRLSGGQRQRIGIARALYQDAAVLILDEATSAQDGLSEPELMSTLLRLRGRYTIILIAHRLSAARACDTLYELADGRLIARGSYIDLLTGSSSFRALAGVY